MNEIVKTEPREVQTVHNEVDLFDTAKFEHMSRIATAMSRASLIPDHLKGDTPEQTFGNCLMVVEQAFRWKMSPLAVAQHTSLVHGKLMYEGKLVEAALQVTLGVDLTFEYNDKEADQYGVKVSGAHPRTGEIVSVEGTVGQWKTFTKDGKNVNLPWRGRDGQTRMLHYRGTREWARLFAPATMLGVYTPDEFDGDMDEYRASKARNVTPGTMDDRYRPPEEPEATEEPEAGEEPVMEPDPPADEQSAETAAPAIPDDQYKPLIAFVDKIKMAVRSEKDDADYKRAQITAIAADYKKQCPDSLHETVRSILAQARQCLAQEIDLDDFSEVVDTIVDKAVKQ